MKQKAIDWLNVVGWPSKRFIALQADIRRRFRIDFFDKPTWGARQKRSRSSMASWLAGGGAHIVALPASGRERRAEGLSHCWRQRGAPAAGPRAHPGVFCRGDRGDKGLRPASKARTPRPPCRWVREREKRATSAAEAINTPATAAGAFCSVHFRGERRRVKDRPEKSLPFACFAAAAAPRAVYATLWLWLTDYLPLAHSPLSCRLINNVTALSKFVIKFTYSPFFLFNFRGRGSKL